MRRVRRDTLEGNRVPECDPCINNILNQGSTYMDWWNSEHADVIPQVLAQTAEDGSTTLKPIAYDYRLSNLCNLKCRMCYEGASSGIEIEKKMMGTLNDFWGSQEMRSKRKAYKDVMVHELMEAIEDKRLREIYWAGGEPLYWKEHWDVLDRLIETDQAKDVILRYNTNLTIVSHKGKSLYDYAMHFKRVYLFLSIDGTGKAVEWQRDGLIWNEWVENFKMVKDIARDHPRHAKVFMDMTVGIPGLIDMHRMAEFAAEQDVSVVMKSVHPHLGEMISPHALPDHIRIPLIDKQQERIRGIPNAKTSLPMIRFLEGLRTIQSHEENWDMAAKSKIKAEMQAMAKYRGDGTNGRPTLEEIYAEEPAILAWWNEIP